MGIAKSIVFALALLASAKNRRSAACVSRRREAVSASNRIKGDLMAAYLTSGTVSLYFTTATARLTKCFSAVGSR